MSASHVFEAKVWKTGANWLYYCVLNQLHLI